MSGYLLDSHVFLWLDANPEKLKAEHLALLSDPAQTLYLSAASVWELSIKRLSGRLHYGKAFSAAARARGIGLLSMSVEHAEAVERLPLLHKDPFDHMLIAQAMVEDLILVTHDAKLHAYNVPMLRV